MRHFADDNWAFEWQTTRSCFYSTDDSRKLVAKLQKLQRGTAAALRKKADELERRKRPRPPIDFPPSHTADDSTQLQYREHEITRLQGEIKRLRDEIKLIVIRQLEQRIAEWENVHKSPTALRHIAEQREEIERRAAKEREERERRWQEQQQQYWGNYWGRQQQPQGPDPFAVLNLPSNATAKQIQARYRTLVKQLHPDMNNGSVANVALFLRVTQAMQQLRRSGRA